MISELLFLNDRRNDMSLLLYVGTYIIHNKYLFLHLLKQHNSRFSHHRNDRHKWKEPQYFIDQNFASYI